jgi:hypothetical protein
MRLTLALPAALVLAGCSAPSVTSPPAATPSSAACAPANVPPYDRALHALGRGRGTLGTRTKDSSRLRPDLQVDRLPLS